MTLDFGKADREKTGTAGNLPNTEVNNPALRKLTCEKETCAWASREVVLRGIE